MQTITAVLELGPSLPKCMALCSPLSCRPSLDRFLFGVLWNDVALKSVATETKVNHMLALMNLKSYKKSGLHHPNWPSSGYLQLANLNSLFFCIFRRACNGNELVSWHFDKWVSRIFKIFQELRTFASITLLSAHCLLANHGETIGSWSKGQCNRCVLGHTGPATSQWSRLHSELERILSVLQAALLGHQDQQQQHIHLQVTSFWSSLAATWCNVMQVCCGENQKHPRLA